MRTSWKPPPRRYFDGVSATGSQSTLAEGAAPVGNVGRQKEESQTEGEEAYLSPQTEQGSENKVWLSCAEVLVLAQYSMEEEILDQ